MTTINQLLGKIIRKEKKVNQKALPQDAMLLPTWDKQGALLAATTSAMPKKSKDKREKVMTKWFDKALADCVLEYSPSASINSRVCLWRGDITKLKIDAITNAANSMLRAGGGICGAIFKAAGRQQLQKACDQFGHCDTGDAVVTSAFELPCKCVVHAVGPMGENRDMLASVYRATLTRCVEEGLRSVALCCISTGIFGYPQDKAAVVALQTVREFLESERGQSLDRVVLCLFLESDVQLYQRACPVIFPLVSSAGEAVNDKSSAPVEAAASADPVARPSGHAPSDSEPSAEKGSEASAEKESEPSAEKGSEASAEKGSEASAEKGSEASAEKGSEASAEKGSEPSAEKGSEPSAEKGSEASAEKGSEPSAEKGSEPSAERTTPTKACEEVATASVSMHDTE